MPEGHTLHRLARLHQRRLAGHEVSVSSPQGRFAAAADRLDGQQFAGAEAWGKHLIHRYRSGDMVHVHLGLYGSFSDGKAPLPAPVGQVRMRIESDDYGTDLRGPTACELYTPEDLAALTSRLGPDPLRKDAEPDVAWGAISKSRKAIGALVMDQKVLAGVGNVYRAEVLFRANINPYRPGASIDRGEWDGVWADLVDLMAVGVRRGKIHVIRAADDHGAPAYGPGRPRTYVYRRAGEPCRICGTTVLMAEMVARKVYWCPTCQPD
ncbi:endonuclease-8 [Williamsia limnetica]|uniref:DNA-(apurinic or apyrimidinic site) lyase n=1 Tax=Williamsia limnetica TaxID=882452 RepID=A0A318RHA5_WILLI|nr:DNA-formamidopyrimidine glycosylase family protein [Williamsia limnetica]PYE13982.1 endonuclease-8 [Williamsia limnetica]